MKKLVFICSPLKGDVKNNIKRANDYCRYAMEIGVIPLAPHTIFTQFLNDEIREERRVGMELGLELLRHCQELWICGPRVSEGMEREIDLAREMGIVIVDMRKDLS